ncbi:nucleoside hydrolase [Pseudalkalibacillus sp. A8]|uniref:nucleoside hydrolase n=1 Tax=Pseudalkalibacillus sp. A8 TaxID=3382641 RepID=UPI0038B4F2E8
MIRSKDLLFLYILGNIHDSPFINLLVTELAERSGVMNVLFFTDSGIDDTLALIYALRHPDINVIGIVAGYGNVARDRTIRNSQYVLSLMGKEEDFVNIMQMR